MDAQTEYHNLIEELKMESELQPETIRDTIVNMLDKQTAKGIKTYGHTLDDCPDIKYDWNLMALEEAIDLIQYLMKKQRVLIKHLNHKESIIQQQRKNIELLAKERTEVHNGETA
jgi:hypothetical protein